MNKWFLNFDFGGRARRSHYWANIGCWLGVFLILGVLLSVSGAIGSKSAAATSGSVLIGLAGAVAMVLSFIDGLAMVFRRAHDTGKSGWVWLLLLIPIVNLLPFYWLMIEDSQQGSNKYGPPVKSFYDPTATAPSSL